MTEFEQYLNAVGMRKAYHQTGKIINWAVLTQLHDADVPLIIELARVGAATLQKIVEWGDAQTDLSDDAAEMLTAARVGFNRVEELSTGGSKKTWGGGESGG